MTDVPCIHCSRPENEHGDRGACIAAGYYGNHFDSGEEKQFLVCRTCCEVFDSITPAVEHGTRDASGMAGWCGDEGFDIVPESEAF